MTAKWTSIANDGFSVKLCRNYISNMSTFSYKVQTFDKLPSDLEKRLNALGRDGWELVSLTPSDLEVKGATDGCAGYTAGEVNGCYKSITIVLMKENQK